MNKKMRVQEAFSKLAQIGDNVPFIVTFIKRTDDTLRSMIAVQGVTRGVTGVGLGFEPKAHNLKVVYDLLKQAYRMVNCEKVLSIVVPTANRNMDYYFRDEFSGAADEAEMLAAFEQNVELFTN